MWGRKVGSLKRRRSSGTGDAAKGGSPQFLSGLRPFCFLVKGLARQGRGMLQEVDDVVRRLSYLFIVVIIVSSLLLAGYSPDLLSLIVVGGMCIISVLGSIYCLAPVISFTNGPAQRAGEHRPGGQLGGQLRLDRGVPDRPVFPPEAAGPAVPGIPRKGAPAAGQRPNRQRPG